MRTQRALMALLICALGASTTACGQSSDSGQTPPPPPAPTALQQGTAPSPAPGAPADAAAPTNPSDQGGTTTTKKLYCPDVSKLKKINMFWGAPGGWRSYSESFVNVIDSFSGAQWIGVNVGKMLCVYRSKSTFEFPVVLQNDTLTPIPEGEKWIVTKEGYRNCISGDILECPFKFEEQKTEKTDIYKELDFFKGKKDYLENGDIKPNN